MENSASRSAAPEALRGFTKDAVASQRVPWKPVLWEALFVKHKELHDELSLHSTANNGISREFIHNHAAKDVDPVEVFLLAMVWGFGTVGYGAHKTAKMLANPKSEDNIRKIFQATRDEGAAAGWSALLADHKVRGLGISFGTKLLYFAGYSTGHELRPLVLDDNVRWSLYDLARGAVPPPGTTVMKKHYLNYLELARSWADDPSWAQEPDVVEYALFGLNGRYPVDVLIPASR